MGYIGGYGRKLALGHDITSLYNNNILTQAVETVALGPVLNNPKFGYSISTTDFLH